MPQVPSPDTGAGLGCGRFSVYLPTECGVYPHGDADAANATVVATQNQLSIVGPLSFGESRVGTWTGRAGHR